MKPGTLEEVRTLQRTRPLRLLILERSTQDVERMLSELKESGYRVEHIRAENQEQFCRAIRNDTIDAILADSEVGSRTGLEALKEVRESGKDIPFLLVTGTLGEEAAVECIKQGAADCVLKEHMSRLPLALGRALEEKASRDAAERAHLALAASEASVRKQLAELELIYRSVPLGFAVYDRDLRYLRVSDELTMAHHPSPTGHVGRTVYEVIPELAEEVAAKLRRVFETGESILNVERRFAVPTTPESWGHSLASYYPLRADDGSVAAVCGVMVDNTERKRAEEALRLSEERYRTQIEHAPEAIVVLDTDQNCFIDVNRNATVLYGHSREELLRLNPVALSPEFQPDGRPSFEAACLYIQAALNGATPVFEWIHRNAAGKGIPCEVRLIRLPSPGGRLIRGSITDIRERKRGEEALRVSEARNRDLVENSIYGISRVTADGQFLDGNPALLSILGCASAAELQELNLVRDVFRFPEQGSELVASCREHGQVRGGESEWRRRDGGIVAVRLHLRWLSKPEHAGSIEIIAEDVTELRAMERQVRQSQKFEAIGQLAGGIAHDFNNVVGAILGWAELGIEQNRKAPQVVDRFAKIREQAERAATLTRQLLAFARRQVLQPRAVDLNAVTSGLVSFLDKVIGKDIELKVITAPLDCVKADPTQIEQVLMNLCLNARDAMPGGGRLVIETEMVELDDAYCRFYPQVPPGRYAVLSVSDTGQGMDAETRERIFEPFFTTKEHGKGTGMGLATVYGIVKQHGGFIHVYSEPGQGSLFRVYLPAHEGAVAEGSSVKAPAPALGEMRGSETVLIAEDHESIREMARQTLLSLGYRVLSAGDGEEALRLCENEAPALAILDVIMPKLGGPAVAAKLTALFYGIPILFTSGYSQDSEGAVPATTGARYLQKPYSPTTLGRIVREILDEKKSPRDPAK
jgi:two-component system cell cycle sensor histidine kinase/response regulator CckA